MLLNLSPTDAFDASINLKGCRTPTAQRAFTYVGDARGFVEQQVTPGRAWHLPPWSMTSIELRFDPPAKP